MAKLTKLLKEAELNESVRTKVFGKIIQDLKKFSSSFPDMNMKQTSFLVKGNFTSLTFQSSIDDMTFFNIVVWVGGSGDSLESVQKVEFNYVIESSKIDNQNDLNKTRISILDSLYNVQLKNKNDWKSEAKGWISKNSGKEYYCYHYMAKDKAFEGNDKVAVDKSIERHQKKFGVL